MNKEIINTMFNRKYTGIELSEVEKVEGFHPNGNVRVIELDDEYFLGYRANTFILIDGWCEEPDNLIGSPCIQLVCNHKGENINTYYMAKREYQDWRDE